MTTAAEPMEGRVMPHDLDAEKSVLGAVLLDNDTVDSAGEVLRDVDFYRQAHQRLFRHMVKLRELREPIDLITLRASLSQSNELDEVGGPSYVSALMSGVPRSTNIEHYARIVRAHADRRRLILAANKVISEAFDADEDTRVLLDHAQQTMFEIGQGEHGAGFKRLSDIMPGVMDQIGVWCESRQGVSGIASGFRDLDDMTRGFQPGNLIIIAARPSMGKSALVLNIAQHVARGGTVGLFSLEMSEEELGVRTLTAEAGIDGHRLQRGFVRESEWARLSAAMVNLSELDLFIDESPFITAFEMRARARRLKASHGLSLLIVDYTQLMVGQERRENRALELGAISRSLKALAKDLKIPVIALSQLSRKVEERTDKRPMLSDLRESGALEQDADVVIFIYRESVYRETEENRGIAEFIIGKQRTGPLGTVRVGWIPEQTRFCNLSDLAQPEDQRLPMGDR